MKEGRKTGGGYRERGSKIVNTKRGIGGRIEVIFGDWGVGGRGCEFSGTVLWVLGF